MNFVDVANGAKELAQQNMCIGHLMRSKTKINQHTDKDIPCGTAGPTEEKTPSHA